MRDTLLEDLIRKLSKMKITVGINSLVSTMHSAYGNHINLFYRLGRSYQDIDFILVNPPRMSIDRFRNLAASVALESESDYLLFLDDDVLVPQPFDFLRKMIPTDADIIAGDVIIRGWPFDHMIFQNKLDENGKSIGLEALKDIDESKRGLIDCVAVGFSLCLIKTSLLKKIQRPYFVTGINNTEDIYFCVKAKDYFPDVRIMADTTIKCAHVLWEEVISADNKFNYKEYYEKQNKIEPDDESRRDRGQKYLDAVEKIVETEYRRELV